MTERPTRPSPEDESAAVKEAKSHVPEIRADDLLRGGRELRIIHGSEIYRLLVTRNNKLILQK